MWYHNYDGRVMVTSIEKQTMIHKDEGRLVIYIFSKEEQAGRLKRHQDCQRSL
jgi:hypothetical protein